MSPEPSSAPRPDPRPRRARPSQRSQSGPAPESPQRRRPSSATGKRKSAKATGKAKVDRPDELSREAFEFIAAVDEYKRRELRSHLATADVLTILTGLGYRPPEAARKDEAAFAEAAIEAYKRTYKRLFPNWSEVFSVLREAGYARGGSAEGSAA